MGFIICHGLLPPVLRYISFPKFISPIDRWDCLSLRFQDPAASGVRCLGILFLLCSVVLSQRWHPFFGFVGHSAWLVGLFVDACVAASLLRSYLFFGVNSVCVPILNSYVRSRASVWSGLRIAGFRISRLTMSSCFGQRLGPRCTLGGVRLGRLLAVFNLVWLDVASLRCSYCLDLTGGGVIVFGAPCSSASVRNAFLGVSVL